MNKEKALAAIQNYCSTYDKGVRRCDICGHIINWRMLIAEKHAEDCPLRIIAQRNDRKRAHKIVNVAPGF